MCGRYTLSDGQGVPEIDAIVRNLRRSAPDAAVTYGDIYPTSSAPAVAGGKGGLAAILPRWGFPVSGKSGVLINARAETAARRTAFADSYLHRRCVLPSTGFYEWDSEKRRYLFRLPDADALYLAGCFREFDGVLRFVILTTAANESMRCVHDRMPVIVPRGAVREWIADTGFALDYLASPMPQLTCALG